MARVLFYKPLLFISVSSAPHLFFVFYSRFTKYIFLFVSDLQLEPAIVNAIHHYKQFRFYFHLSLLLSDYIILMPAI